MQTGPSRKALLIALALAALLCGCVTDSQPQRVFVRMDGRAYADDPQLARQYQAATASCRESAQQFQSARGSSGSFSQRDLPAGIAASNRGYGSSGPISERCMADQGYVLVSRDQADAKLAEFAAAAEKSKREAAPQTGAPARGSR
jgi:hypothetical protein